MKKFLLVLARHLPVIFMIAVLLAIVLTEGGAIQATSTEMTIFTLFGFGISQIWQVTFWDREEKRNKK